MKNDRPTPLDLNKVTIWPPPPSTAWNTHNNYNTWHCTCDKSIQKRYKCLTCTRIWPYKAKTTPVPHMATCLWFESRTDQHLNKRANLSSCTNWPRNQYGHTKGTATHKTTTATSTCEWIIYTLCNVVHVHANYMCTHAHAHAGIQYSRHMCRRMYMYMHMHDNPLAEMVH